MNIVWTWDIVRRVIEVLWLINIAFAVWTVFRTRRDIASTWAWLLVLSVFPVIGLSPTYLSVVKYQMRIFLAFGVSRKASGSG